MFNFTTPNLELREIFWDIRFRQAMSVAINRDEINELVYFGFGQSVGEFARSLLAVL